MPHIARHEFCCRLGDDGFDLGEIKKLSGHRSDAMVARYDKDNKVALRARMMRDATFDPNALSGGDVPEFAPSNAPVTAKLRTRTKAPAAVAPAPVPLDLAAAMAMFEKLQAAGINMAGMTLTELAQFPRASE